MPGGLPDEWGPDLETARRLLEPLPSALLRIPLSDTQEVLDAALAVRRELARARTLLDSTAAFHAGWDRLHAALTAGYTAGGTPARIIPAGRLSLAG